MCSYLTGTHICSMSYIQSSPNKNFIHCSQIQYLAQVSNDTPFLWGWPGSPKRGRRLGLPVMDGINLLS